MGSVADCTAAAGAQGTARAGAGLLLLVLGCGLLLVSCNTKQKEINNKKNKMIVAQCRLKVEADSHTARPARGASMRAHQTWASTPEQANEG